MSGRSGSVDSVVLPVPERPKKRATSPSAPTLAEQCIDRDAALRQQVVEDREDGFLDLPAVRGAANDDEPLGKVYDDERAGPGAVLGRVCLKARHIDDGELGLMARDLVRRRHDEQVARKQVVPGQFVDHAHREPVAGVGAGEAVLDIKVPPLHVGAEAAEQRVELLRRKGLVVVAPPDGFGALGVAHHEFVLGRPPGVRAGAHDKGAKMRDLAFASAHGVLAQIARGEVPKDLPGIRDAECRQ